MKRNLVALMVSSLSLLACGGAPKPATEPEVETVGTGASAAKTDMPASTSHEEKKSTESTEEEASDKPKKDECAGAQFDKLEEVLIKSACEVPVPNGAKPIDAKAIEVKVTPSASKTTPGGHVDLVVTFSNKSKEPMPLVFTLDPMPRFEVEVYDAKNKRIDPPTGNPPPLPKGVAPRVPGEPKAARITLAANGTARLQLGWDAKKMKWAPEKLKGTPPEKGYPRTVAGPLNKGNYVLRVVTPLIGVAEGTDKAISAPKVTVEVGK